MYALEGLVVAFQTVVPDFVRLLIADGKHVEQASILGRMKRIVCGWLFATDEWRGFTPQYMCLPIPSKNWPSCAQRNSVCAQGI